MDKVVVVTGGCRNTGLEIVDRFLREGAKVFLCGTVKHNCIQLYVAVYCNSITSFITRCRAFS